MLHHFTMSFKLPLATLTVENSTLVKRMTTNISNSTASPVANGSRGFSASETSVMTAFLIVLILLTLFGNGLVLGIFYNYKPLRTVTNYFIVSLACADILVAALSMPIWIAYIHGGLAPHEYGIGLYRLWICLDITSGVSSVLNLSFVSVDRYVHIILPLHYLSVITEKRAKFILIGIWLYAAGLAAVKGIAFDWERPNYEILIFVLGFLVPFSVMGLCYFKIFGAARKHAKAVKMSGCLHGSRESSKDFKAAKTIAVVILAFFLCWCPFFLVNLFFGLFSTWKVPGALISVTKWLHYTNSALNPIIYACFNKEYRYAFRALLTRKKLKNGHWDIPNNQKKNASFKKNANLDSFLDTLLNEKQPSPFNDELKESHL